MRQFYGFVDGRIVGRLHVRHALIEKLGGLLEDRCWDDVDQEMIRRYRIRLI